MHLAQLDEIEDQFLPKHYPVVKVRPFGQDRTLAGPPPAIRWSVGERTLRFAPHPTDQGSDIG
jgi:hypothetical protein